MIFNPKAIEFDLLTDIIIVLRKMLFVLSRDFVHVHSRLNLVVAIKISNCGV